MLRKLNYTYTSSVLRIFDIMNREQIVEAIEDSVEQSPSGAQKIVCSKCHKVEYGGGKHSWIFANDLYKSGWRPAGFSVECNNCYKS